MTARPPQVVDTDLRLVDDEKVPQVLYEWLGEEGLAFADVVLLENFIARQSYFLEIELELFAESLLISLLLCNRWEKQ